jgi:hypothetical protein
MSSEREIKPGMFVLWTGTHGGPPLPETVFLGFVVAELPRLLHEVTTPTTRQATYDHALTSRRFSVFIRTNTMEDAKIIPIFEHYLAPYSKKPSKIISS